MSERRTGHERFRNLFKSPSKEQIGAPVPSRNRASNNKSPFKPPKPVGSKESVGKSTKSVKRSKPTAKKTSGNRKKKSSNSPSPHKSPESSNNSNRRASKSPHPAVQPIARTPTTPTTPPIIVGSKARTPNKKKPAVPPQKYNGQDVHEKTQMCNTVFENDVGGPNGGIETIQLAQAKIKERKLQWKKEEPKTDPRAEHTKTSGSHDTSGNEEDRKGSREDDRKGSKEDDRKGSKEDDRHEANVTVRDHTIFENDENPAAVKEEERKLQWIPQAAEQCMSEPAVRKKKSSEEKQRGVVSDRPPREHAPIGARRSMPMHSLHTPAIRTPVKTATGHSPVATTPTSTVAHSPSTRPLILDVSPTFGQVTGSPPKEAAKQNVSCYLAPNMQQQQEYNLSSKKSGAGPVDSEPYI